MMHSNSLFLLTLLAMPAGSSASGQDFLSARSEALVERSYIQGLFNEMLGSGHGIDTARLSTVKAKLSPLFKVLPKNQFGRLVTPVMRYAVQRYFRQWYGWVIKGFEPNANKSHVPDEEATSVLQSNAPEYVEQVLQKTLSNGGFGLQDLVIAVATIERLIGDEVVRDVENSFRLNGLLPTQDLSQDLLTSLLFSYFVVEHLEGNSTNLEHHQIEKHNITTQYPYWQEVRDFVMDISVNDIFQKKTSMNPFTEQVFGFDDVARIAMEINDAYGAYSHEMECIHMKARLSLMDPHGTGRAKIADFYRAAIEGKFQFIESEDYLNKLGALDTSSKFFGPQVMTSNYMAGMNNCLSSSPFYSVCCLNECDGIYKHIEAHVQKSTASAAEIVRVIEGGIASSSILSSSVPLDVAGNMSAPLRLRLDMIAAQHKDAIPLHGRLLAQWLHYAFPRECPFPHMSGTVADKTPTEMKEVMRERVTGQEALAHIKSEAAKRQPSPEASLAMWTPEEELLGLAEDHRQGSTLRTIVAVMLAASLAALVLKELAGALQHLGVGAKHRKVAEPKGYYV